MKYTDEQLDIIQADKGNILVSAAAGSGKTAVLTERIVQRIISGKTDVQNILVMTFTEAAAREMKGRIEANLRQVLSSEQDDEKRQYLGRQLSLLPGSKVSTIHSFCLSVIYDFAYVLKDDAGQPLVDSNFSIVDGIEADILLTECLDEWMIQVYEMVDQDDESEQPIWKEAFFHLVDGYSSSHSDAGVRGLILEIFHYLRSLPDYNHFIDSKLDELRQAANDFSASPHAAQFFRELRLRLDRAIDALPELENLLDAGIKFLTNQVKNQDLIQQYTAMIAALKDLDVWLQNGGHDWDEIRRRSLPLSDIALPRSSSGDASEKIFFAQIFCEKIAEVIYFLTGACGTDKYKKNFIYETVPVFTLSSEQVEQDIKFMLPAVTRLFYLVKGLDSHYAQRKKEAGLIDFNDFEHLALGILRQDEARIYYRNKFHEIYVDEYQDTSSIQETIITEISSANCLVVGDIKQSIYKFRHARPSLFIDRADRYRRGEEGCLHELNRNFRSVSGILSAVNAIFHQLMSTGAGEIEYDKQHALVEHREDDPEKGVPVHLLLFNRYRQQDQQEAGETYSSDSALDDEGENIIRDTEQDYEQLERDQQEALLVVREIHKLRQKSVSWQNMAVLCRTRSIAAAYAGQLSRHGIPILQGGDSDYLDIPALRIAESLVHVLDNSRQDIPLAAVMRSDLLQGRFSDDELIQIRLAAKTAKLLDTTFSGAAKFVAAYGQGELREKVNEFLVWLASWRDREKDMRTGELLDAIFRQTGWMERLAMQPEGIVAIQVLRQFIRLADQFEFNRQRGLYNFARYLETLRARGDLSQQFNLDSRNEDGVRVMTIHGSKGLEFPIVFLAGTNFSLSPRDNKSPLLISESLGIGMNYADPEKQIRYPTHLKVAMLQEVRATAMAEEMRLLYVAMTRARDQLYIAGTINLQPEKGSPRLSRLISQARSINELQLPYYLVLSCRSYLEWLIFSLSRQNHIDLSPLEDEDTSDNRSGCSQPQCTSISLDWIEYADLINEVHNNLPVSSMLENKLVKDINFGDEIDEDTFLILQKKIAGSYRFTKATRIPAKITVSDLKRREDILAQEDSEADTDFAFSRLEAAPADTTDPRGINLTLHHSVLDETGEEAKASTGATIGTLLHTVLRYLDLVAAHDAASLDELERQLQEMRNLGMISEDEKADLAPFIPALLSFIKSELAAEMVGAAVEKPSCLFVEIPFTLAVPATELYTEADGLASADQVMIQGIIDCWYEKDGQIVLVDFKSDYIEGDEDVCAMVLSQRYQLQLSLYARAIETIIGRPVSKSLIWHIRSRRVYEILPRLLK